MRTITYPLILVTAFIATFPLHAQRANTPLRCTGVAEFVDVVGRDTVIRSRVTFTDTSFSSANHDVGQGALIRYSGRLNATGDIRTLHIEIWPQVADTAGPPAQIADVTVEDTVVNARVAAPSRGVQMQRDRLPAQGK